MNSIQSDFHTMETDILNMLNDMSVIPTICISCSSTKNTLVKLDCSHIFCRPCLFRRLSSGNHDCPTCFFPFAQPTSEPCPPLDLRDSLDEMKDAARMYPDASPIIVNAITTRSALSELLSLTQDQILCDIDEEAENAVFYAVAASLTSYNSDGWWATHPAQFKEELEDVVKVSLLEELKTLHSKDLVALGCQIGDGDEVVWKRALRPKGGIESVRVQWEVWKEIVGLLLDWTVWGNEKDLNGC